MALPLLHLPPAAHGVDERDWLDSVALRSPLELLHEGAPSAALQPYVSHPATLSRLSYSTKAPSPRRAAPPSPRRAAPQAIYPNHAVPLSCHSCLARPPATCRWVVARRPNGKARCSWKARRGDLYTCMCAAAAGPTHRTRWPLAARPRAALTCPHAGACVAAYVVESLRHGFERQVSASLLRPASREPSSSEGSKTAPAAPATANLGCGQTAGRPRAAAGAAAGAGPRTSGRMRVTSERALSSYESR